MYDMYEYMYVCVCTKLQNSIRCVNNDFQLFINLLFDYFVFIISFILELL